MTDHRRIYLSKIKIINCFEAEPLYGIPSRRLGTRDFVYKEERRKPLKMWLTQEATFGL
jgi:hypothetical protein